jgi:hypothetical protein
LPYLSGQETAAFLRAASLALEPGGVLYVSTMLGKSDDSGFERCSTGDQVYVNYHSEDEVIGSLENLGFMLLRRSRVPSPSEAAKKTTDLIVIAQK